MKIGFINPTSVRRNWGSSFLPLGIAYLGAQTLNLGWDTFVLDRDLMLSKNNLDLDQTDSLTQARLLQQKPDYVAISATTPIVTDAFKCAKMVKALLPKTIVILGGVHASVMPLETMEACPEIDYLAMGEGEMTIREILAGKAPQDILGICYRLGDRTVKNLSRPPISNLDAVGLPARHLLDMAEYTKRSKYLIRGVSLRGTSIFTSRGCPYSCSFCSGPLAFGRGVRFNSVPHVIEEIESLIRDYQIEGLYFADDMFSSRRDRAIAICDELIKRGINKQIVFCVQLKVSAADAGLLLKLKEAGCIQVEYGFESGSQRILDLMNKGVKIEQNYQAAALTKKVGLRFLANIISGLPGETEADFNQTMEFLDMVKPDVIGFYRLILLPGSKLYLDYMASHPQNKSSNWDDCLQDDLNSNYTAIADAKYYNLFKKASGEIAILNARNYIRYNLTRDWRGTLIEAAGLVFNKLRKGLLK